MVEGDSTAVALMVAPVAAPVVLVLGAVFAQVRCRCRKQPCMPLNVSLPLPLLLPLLPPAAVVLVMALAPMQLRPTLSPDCRPPLPLPLHPHAAVLVLLQQLLQQHAMLAAALVVVLIRWPRIWRLWCRRWKGSCRD